MYSIVIRDSADAGSEESAPRSLVLKAFVVIEEVYGPATELHRGAPRAAIAV